MTSPVNYPALSPAQQKQLPALIRATALPTLFSDSTHQLWDCQTDQGSLILKVCNNSNVARSTFWQGMHQLFEVNLPRQLGGFEQVYTLVSHLSPLKIPEFIASASASKDDLGFVAAKKIPGKMIATTDINADMVIDLAKHIAKLHQQSQASWGRLTQATFSPQQWPLRLQDTLKKLAGSRQIPNLPLEDIIKSAENCSSEQFVPLMPDLRWDQFLQVNDKLSALVDLDAFVFAPRELDFVLLEYLLDKQQAAVFAQLYQQSNNLPDLSVVRRPYRLLLFLMNVLGEEDIHTWMQAATKF